MVEEDGVKHIEGDALACGGRRDEIVASTVKFTLDVDEAGTGRVIECVEIVWVSFFSSSGVALLLALGGDDCQAAHVPLLS